MLFEEIVAVCSDNRTEHINTACGERMARVANSGINGLDQGE